MGDKTGITWADATWNPITGCRKVSPGCDNCYAVGVSARMIANPKVDSYAGTVKDGDWTGQVNLIEGRLDQPIRWKRPRRIFVNSMSDLFQHSVPDWFIRDVFDVMREANWHTYMVLTKRPARMAGFLNDLADMHGEPSWPLPHVLVGTSVESARYKFRARMLVEAPAVSRFLSVEPLLGSIDFGLGGIDWVIVGGESGRYARPMRPEWVRDIRDQCAVASVPFLFKQWGEWGPDEGGVMRRVGKHRTGRLLDGVLHDEYPEILR